MTDSKALTDGLNIFVRFFFLGTISQSTRSSRPGKDRNTEVPVKSSSIWAVLLCKADEPKKERRDLWSFTCSKKLQELMANLCGVRAKKYSHFMPFHVLTEWEKQRQQHGGDADDALWGWERGDENGGWIWKRPNPEGSLLLFTELTAGHKLVMGTMVRIPNPLLISFTRMTWTIQSQKNHVRSLDVPKKDINVPNNSSSCRLVAHLS